MAIENLRKGMGCMYVDLHVHFSPASSIHVHVHVHALAFFVIVSQNIDFSVFLFVIKVMSI